MGRNHRISRRAVLAARARHRDGAGVSAARLRASRATRRRGRRRFWRRELRARAEAARPETAGHAGRAEPDLYRLPVQQRRDRRPAPIEEQQFGYDKIAAAGVTVVGAGGHRRRRSRRGPSRSPTARRSATTGWCWRPASTCASTRCRAMTKRPPRRCRMPGRPASRRCCCAGSSRPWTTAASW